VTKRGVVAFLAGCAVLAVRGAAARAEVVIEGQEVPPAGAVGSTLGPDQDPNFEVDTSLAVSRYAISYPPGVPGTTGTQEGLSMTVVAFATPLHDDDSPYSMQPFLQRESTFSLSIAGGHFDTANPYGGADRTEWYGSLGAQFDAYLKRWFALFGGASYGYSELSDVGVAQTGHSFGANLGAGFRYRDTRLDLWAAEQGDRSAGAFGPWRGSLAMSVYTVIKRRVSLTATGTLVQGGGEGFFQAELHPTKKTGVFASGIAGRFEPYVDPVLVTRYIGRAGFVGWFDATTALVGQYSLTYEKDPATANVTNGYDSLSHALLVEAYFRFP
jgi:hypothetical protein